MRPIIYVLIGLILCSPSVKCEKPNTVDKKIVVLGSSMAAGWVTSYQEKYDFKNGYAYRLHRYLKNKGFTLVNKSFPGDDTKSALARFEKDVLSENPEYLFIGLSMSNEGLETENPDSVMVWFEKGMKKIIAKCEENGIKPILGSCYVNNNFTPKQFEYLKKMNIQMNSLGYPMVNLLGALGNGQGHFPEGITFDPNHPLDIGHEEFFLAFVPGFFDALEENFEIPLNKSSVSGMHLGEKSKHKNLFIEPKKLIHSFTFSFDFLFKKPGEVASVKMPGSKLVISIDPDNKLLVKGGEVDNLSQPLSKKQWHQLTICQRYLDGTLLFYLNGELIKSVKKQFEPLAFILGNHQLKCEYKNLKLYRSALNQDEIKLMDKYFFHASLDYYSPLENEDIRNYANSEVKACFDPQNEKELLEASSKLIAQAQLVRDKQLKVEHKKAIDLNPEAYKKFAGKYKIAENDFFTIEVKNDKIYFTDRGRTTEILPESPNKFFIHFPGDITFTFEKDEEGILVLHANFNGYKMQAKKI